MKKIDLISLLILGLGVWFIFGDNGPSSSGQGSGSVPSTTSGSQSGKENHQEKIQDNSQSVLNNLEGQLDKFADELASDIEGVENLNPEVTGFENGVPEAYAPNSTTPYGTKEKLEGDLEFRLKKFNHDAQESEQEFTKTHDISGIDQKTYQDLVNKHRAQKKQIMDRHRVLVQQYGAEAQTEPKLR